MGEEGRKIFYILLTTDVPCIAQASSNQPMQSTLKHFLFQVRILKVTVCCQLT